MVVATKLRPGTMTISRNKAARARDPSEHSKGVSVEDGIRNDCCPKGRRTYSRAWRHQGAWPGPALSGRRSLPGQGSTAATLVTECGKSQGMTLAPRPQPPCVSPSY